MKKVFIFLTVILLSTSAFAQTPQKMSYQAIIRNLNNNLITNTSVGMQISILQGSVDGNAVYVEREFPTSNSNGLVTIEIGTGIVVSGNFATIDWANGPYFIKTETDLNGGASYTISGVSELLSVPYALFSANSLPGPTGPMGPAGSAGSTGAPGQQGPIGLTGATGGYPVHSIGETYGGGIVFFVYDDGQHGLIAAPSDQSLGIRWFGGSNTLVRATANGVGAGLKNTVIIIASQALVDGNAFASTVCNEYNVKVDGVTYGDWYLPSIHELNLLYLQKTVVGGFASYYYWSSSEFGKYESWGLDFTNGIQDYVNKGYELNVRAIRAF